MLSAKTEKHYIGKKTPFASTYALYEDCFNPFEQYRMKL